MKSFTLFISCFILISGIAFAENPSDDTQKNVKSNSATSKSEYKSSPRLNYHSQEPAKDDLGLERLKPMLNQMTGNNQNGEVGGMGLPSGTYNF